MNGPSAGAFFRRYAVGLTLLVLVYLLITILRSVRADFAPEIWRGLGVDRPAERVRLVGSRRGGLGVLLLNGSAVLHPRQPPGVLRGAGAGRRRVRSCVGAALVGLAAGLLSPFAFMVLHGLGLYLPYVAIHTTIFERLIAMTRDRGNIGYLMYLADAFGYLGYVGGDARAQPGRADERLPGVLRRR